MLLTLTCHPETPCDAVKRIEVDVSRPRAAGLILAFRAIGDVGRLQLPAWTDPVRTDELWRHTCFEAFVQGRAGYYEFNLSPSSAWAVYGFDAYRSGMSSPDGVCLYTMEAMKTDDRYELSGEFDLDGLSNLAFDEPYSLGLSAVIEQTDGRKSYWALAHAPGKPDFHHPDAFVACLPPVEHS